MCASLTRVLSVRGVEQLTDKGEEVGRVDGERETETETETERERQRERDRERNRERGKSWILTRHS